MKCLGKNCPNNCCSNKFIGLNKALKNCSSDKFVQIKLNHEEVDRILKSGRNDLIEKRDNEFFLKLNNDNSCKAFKNGKCDIYEVRPDVCKLYPYYFDPFCGICIDKNCPGNFKLNEIDDTIYQLLLNRINLFRREQNRHYFFDGYNILNKELKDMKKIKNFFEDIKKEFGINENCKIHLIPYFHCKDKGMEGISAILLANNFHFTCHTFSSKETLFIDCFGNAINSDKLTKKILQYYPTNNYDLCNNKQDIDGKFGKHIVINLNDVIKYEKAKKLIREILHTIKMTKISELFEIKNSDYEYDLLQPIAESHISIHCHLGITYIDIFSCKTFDENTILNVLNFKNFDIKTIERGIYFK